MILKLIIHIVSKIYLLTLPKKFKKLKIKVFYYATVLMTESCILLVCHDWGCFPSIFW